MSQPDKNLNVLIVDDQQRMRWTIKEMLRRVGYLNFLEADDGDVALDRLRYQPVDLVLSDWRMPRMTGVEVLKFIREDDQLRSLPFVMITAEVNTEIVAEAGEYEVDAYLLKPFTLATLEEKINEALERRRSLTPIDTHLELGLTYLRAGQFEKALGEYQEALKINSNSPRTLLALGAVFERQGNDVRALECYEKAIKLQPKYLKGHEALAKLHQRLNRLDQAARHLKEATSISPKNVERHFQLAQALMSSGQNQEASQVLKTVMKVAKGQYADVARRVGEAMMTIGLAGEAEAAFRQALEANPQDIHLFNRLGIAFRKQGKFKEAVENYHRALSIAPENEVLYYNLARAHLDASDRDAALRSLSKALTLKPDFEEARELASTLMAG
ncbi:MAG: tetratricopeptide repeat protein [Pseudomonadota bacterium]